ncbi:MAG: hypothetical protein ACREJ2_18270 [Planctomycetota bacterium]
MTKTGAREKLAKDSLYELVRHVFNSHQALLPITYRELAMRIGHLDKNKKGQGHGMGPVLGIMGHLIENLEGEWGDGIPHIQSLVVNKTGPNKGLPDDGINEFWPRYEMLTLQEKKKKVQDEYVKISKFGTQWNIVLDELGLDPIQLDDAHNRGDHGGGESPEHLKLKEYVRDHPELVGAKVNDAVRTEYELPSSDVVDIFFQNRIYWTAVEVKSRVSDQLERDFMRGIYQCVKYRAILEAMRKNATFFVPSEIRNFLVLETQLPEKYRALASALGVRVIENVKP